MGNLLEKIGISIFETKFKISKISNFYFEFNTFELFMF